MLSAIEKLNVSAEKKLVIKNDENTICNVICLSDLFQTIYNIVLNEK